MIKYLCFYAVAFGLLTLVTEPSLADHSVSHEETHGEWASLLINTDVGPVARAITVRLSEEGELSTFNIDSPSSDCDAVIFSVNINLSEVPRSSLESPLLFGKFRVDRKQVHDITYTLSIERGNDYISIFIRDWSRFDSVLEEIMSGDTARFQFRIDGEEYYYRFSLDGSREAMVRQDKICREAEGSDEQFFDEPEDDDAKYFRT